MRLMPQYSRQLLNINHLHMQLLSIIDISILVTTIANAIARGTLDRRSLLDNPLISWRNVPLSSAQEIVTKELSGVLAYNIENDPILQKYNSLVERVDIKMGMCILSSQTIAGILQLHDETTSFKLMSIAESQPELLLL